MKYATRAAIEKLINGRYITTDKLLRMLLKAGYTVDNLTDECGYTNMHIKSKEGYIRVYKAHKRRELLIQDWKPVKICASGIPTFDPSKYFKNNTDKVLTK